ncbi:histidine phosphotransferase family protein [Aestuariispira insulae]|uniref:Histidine phosphotransferase ChpT n=1 Tax=Aestuariispira insulae TaxID=1461337 RepID=A0A3D9HVS4_9PROT|nr:histidine phosphotransferase family protein [Aestuariispira insulae]RED53592.1 histidine phosphotransferase ChpT [Aestuariispira insulae]
MTHAIDLKVAELLSSRLCHELVGSAGAIGNGIELIQDSLEDREGLNGTIGPDDEMQLDALKLVEQSAQQVISRLKFYRMAYGFAGHQASNIAELRSIAQSFVGDGKVRLSWPLPPIVPDLRDGDGKLVLNLIAMAVEGLPRGGEIEVVMDETALILTLTGDDCNLHQDLQAATDIAAPVDTLTARTVHGFWTALLADKAGRRIEIGAPSANRLVIQASLVD